MKHKSKWRRRNGSRTDWAKFNQHRLSAKTRGIEFKLSFDQWLTIWEESGHFADRGRRKDQYVMARLGDRGAYEPGNVKIITAAQNISEGGKGKKHPFPMTTLPREMLVGMLRSIALIRGVDNSVILVIDSDGVVK